MLKIIFLLSALFATFPDKAFARSELVSKIVSRTDVYKIAAELYYDKGTKKADLWVDYFQGTTEDDRIAFKATSHAEKMKDAEFKLIAQPTTKLEGRTTLIFDAFALSDGEYNTNRGMAVLFRFPLNELASPTVKNFLKNFPGSIARDSNGRPLYVKAVLCRLTEYQVFPVAAFDVELDL